MDRLIRGAEGVAQGRRQIGGEVGPVRRWQVVIAGAAIAPGSFDDHEVGRRGEWSDHASRRDRHEQAAPGLGELIGDEDRVRAADGAWDDSDLAIASSVTHSSEW